MEDNVVRLITIRGRVEGVDQATASLKNLAAAQSNVATVSDTASKSSLSVEQAYQRQTLRVDEAARMQTKVASETKIADQALRQGLVTQQEHAARIDAINEKYGQASPLAQAFGKSLQGVQGQLLAIASGAGPVGTFLSALGPWGLAAAAGIGAVVGAFNSLNEAAHRAAERGTELRRFNETTGISIDQARGLGKAAAQMGIDSDTARGSIEKFVIAWEEARLGQGNMLAQLEKTDLGLAREVQTATDGTAAFNALAAAIRKAVDEGNRGEALRLARAAGGRGGAESIITMSLAASAAGGAGNLVNENSRLSSQALEDLSKMTIKLKEMQKAADDAWTAFGGKAALQMETKWAEAKKDVGDMATSLSDLISKGSYWTMVWERAKAMVQNKPLPKFPWEVNSSGAEPSAVWGPSAAAKPAPGAAGGLTPEAQLEASNKLMALLGNAATQTETLTHKQLELAVSSKLVEGGHAAAARQLRELKISQDQANEAVRQSLGVSSEQEIINSRLVALDEQVRKGLQLTNEQREQAVTIIQREARAQAEANQVRASALPGLKQMEIDAGRLDKAFDQWSTGGLQTASSSLADMEMGTVKVSDGFKSMALSITRSALQIINQMILMQTIGKGLQALFGGFGGGTGDTTGGMQSFFDAQSASTRNANGNAFFGGNVIPFARGGVVDSPTFFPMANGAGLMGEAGPEAVMPLRRGPDGKLGVVAAGGGATVHNSFAINYSGSPPSDPGEMAAHAAEMRRQFEAMMNEWAIKEQRTGGLLRAS